MLQSPNFLFWLEQTPNPKWKAYAAAARLSYFLWNTTPDEALLDTAAAGELNTAAGVEGVARRMLDNPKAQEGIGEFVAQWLRFDRVITSSRAAGLPAVQPGTRHGHDRGDQAPHQRSDLERSEFHAGLHGELQLY
jgi:hypothetical protein